MEIQNTSNISSTQSGQNTTTSKNYGGKSFASELESSKSSADSSKNDSDTKTEKTKASTSSKEEKDNKKVNDAIDGLEDTVDEINKQKNGKSKNNEELAVLESNINLQEQKDNWNLQMGANMNFNSDGQPFSEFIKQENMQGKLRATAKDLAEEQAIMSTMEENIALINRNSLLKEQRTAENEKGLQDVGSQANLTMETIFSYDNVIMDKADVDFFVDLVNNGSIDMNKTEHTQKSSQVSKVLADLLAKSMNENKPVRIDFDNDISVIIKITKSGKVSADFLPSSQVAEAYLKENLPLLKQRFDEKNIDYDELNHRKQKQDNQDSRKKGDKDE